jgi:Ulp1 protease family, C-terminal catalytic domain
MRSKTRKVRGGEVPSPGPSQCHPRVTDTRAGCLPETTLREIAASLGVGWKGTAATMRRTLEKTLGVEKGKERSFLMATPLPASKKTALAKQYLRPAQPAAWKSDPDMWLNTNDIANVVKQFEEARSDFEFMGPFPIDFAAPDPYEGSGRKCLIDEICNFRVEKALAAGKKYIGIVYNLDPHFKGGSHWVANFIDIPKKRCYYFDSYGMEPPEQVAKFMRWLTTHDPEIQLRYNARRFQYCNTECGMYSTYFIILMLLGVDFDRFIKFVLQKYIRARQSDRYMLDLRDWFFST